MHRLFLWICLFAAIGTVACGGRKRGGTDVDVADQAEDTPVTPGIAHCEANGYPCEMDEVPDEIRTRANALQFEALHMLANGGTPESVLAFLESQDDVAEVEHNDTNIVFMVDGGMPRFIFPDRMSEEVGDDFVFASPVPQTQTAQYVVGENRNAAGEARIHKTALFLEPFAWQMNGAGISDPLMARLLWQESDAAGWVPRPDYQGRITLLRDDSESFVDNRTNLRPQVDVPSFLRIKDYDFTMIHTHGGVASKGTLRGLVGLTSGERVEVTGLDLPFIEPFGTTDAMEQVWARLQEYKAAGIDISGVTVSCGEYVRLDVTGVKGVDAQGREIAELEDLGDSPYVCHPIITSSFFQKNNVFLSRGVVYLHACNGLANTSLGSALVPGGSQAMVIGHDDTFIVGNASWSNTLRLIDLLTRERLAVREAMSQLQAEGKAQAPVRDRTVSMYVYPAGGPDAYLVEPIHFIEPDNPYQWLESNSTITILGVPDDGTNDSIEVGLFMGGINTDIAPEGAPFANALTQPHSHEFNVNFYVDEQLVHTAKLVEPMGVDVVEPLPGGEHWQTLTTTISLGVDVPASGQAISLRAELELPEGNLAIATLDQVTVAPSLCAFQASFGGQYIGNFEGVSGFLIDESDPMRMVEISLESVPMNALNGALLFSGLELTSPLPAPLVVPADNESGFIFDAGSGVIGEVTSGNVTIDSFDGERMTGHFEGTVMVMDPSIMEPLISTVTVQFDAVVFGFTPDSPYIQCRAAATFP